MAKRKSVQDAAPEEESAPRRSSRLRGPAASTARQSRAEVPAAQEKANAAGKEAPASGRSAKKTKSTDEPSAKKQRTASKPADTRPSAQTTTASKPAQNGSTQSGDGSRQYWLLKAEPETRLENGVDVRFSIDDLAAKTEPEPWDGIRSYAARNHLRAMKKGDLAFFYHSNCKEPGIVGTMEIVREHSPDLSAHDPKAPYYDPSSKPEDPKWSVVHVQFRSKFAVPIGLKELRALGDAPGKPLASMQLLKQSRLSVSKVSAEEWAFLNRLAEEKARKAQA
ncbi:hypothetical protein VTK73DRAFT_8794 [Phialemonium thermophilum]|uniref:EVE domain-containing protein n=1 Tax=Phialemonium thermophilum TaxID=223376 RepID=A0ABR3W691_9PEZI